MFRDIANPARPKLRPLYDNTRIFTVVARRILPPRRYISQKYLNKMPIFADAYAFFLFFIATIYLGVLGYTWTGPVRVLSLLKIAVTV